MKIHIIFNIKNKPTGGGNQFLKALQKYFISKNIYTEKPEFADIFLFNSYQYIPQVIRLKKKYPNKIFIHRIDGPIHLYSRPNDKRDKIINITNKYIADATVFQSKWSKKANLATGLKKSKIDTVITNAPDSTIFNKKDKKDFNFHNKIKLIATSWSSWHKKGFPIYKWLDENLDFSKYEMTFCGNTNESFKNIKHISPLPSSELAKELKNHDIFITASQKDPCSNSLIEALHCGLPAIALNDGGHPEIIKEGGELFQDQEEIPELLKKISENYEYYTNKINIPNINEVAEAYIQFFKSVIEQTKNKTKKLNFIYRIRINAVILIHKIKVELRKIIKQ